MITALGAADIQICLADDPERRVCSGTDESPGIAAKVRLRAGSERGLRVIAAPGDAADPEIALSIRQPWAELIMRGIKTIEVRTRLTHKRARVQVYASSGRVQADDEARVQRDHDIDVDGLPRGVLVGTIEIVDCQRVRPSDSDAAGFSIRRDDASFGWHLARPVRDTRLRAPERQPQPTFFRPF